MKIEKQEKYIVDGHTFSTKEAAEKRVKELEIAKDVFDHNSAKLDSSSLKYVPVEIDGEEDIFYKEKEYNWVVWKSIIKEKELRYYSEEADKIKLLTPQQYLDRLDGVNIDSNEWGHFIHAIILFSDHSTVDYKQILNKLGKIEITPQYCYD